MAYKHQGHPEVCCFLYSIIHKTKEVKKQAISFSKVNLLKLKNVFCSSFNVFIFKLLLKNSLPSLPFKGSWLCCEDSSKSVSIKCGLPGMLLTSHVSSLAARCIDNRYKYSTVCVCYKKPLVSHNSKPTKICTFS